VSSIGFDTPGCESRQCVVTMDRNRLVEATAYRFDHPDSPWAYAPADQRVPAGASVTLVGYITFAFPDRPVFPVTVNWFDARTGEFYGTASVDSPYSLVEITLRFGVGVHTLAFYAADSGDPVSNSEYHEFRVIAHEP